VPGRRCDIESLPSSCRRSCCSCSLRMLSVSWTRHCIRHFLVVRCQTCYHQSTCFRTTVYSLYVRGSVDPGWAAAASHPLKSTARFADLQHIGLYKTTLYSCHQTPGYDTSSKNSGAEPHRVYRPYFEMRASLTENANEATNSC